MARHQGQGPQRPIKGFRPGKEPPELRKRQVRQQFGDMTPAQERLVGMLAERTPEQARALLRRWRLSFLAGTIVAAVLAVVLAFWSVIAAVLVAIVALALLFFWWRLHRQRESFEAMADAVSGPGGKRRKR